MAEKSESDTGNTRWWESYLVRYFLGFIVGAICVTIIGVYTDLIPGADKVISDGAKRIEAESKYGLTAVVIAVSLLGLAYCYFASTPITVMHAGRYGSGAIDRLSRYFWFGWVLAIATLMLPSAAVLFLAALPMAVHVVAFIIGVSAIFLIAWKAADREKIERSQEEPVPLDAAASLNSFEKYIKKSKKPQDRKALLALAFWLSILSLSFSVPNLFEVPPDVPTLRLFSMGVPAIWIGVAQYAVLFRIFTQEANYYYFYKKLFHARRLKDARDVRDTYTHLREHSNAIFIVMVELSILALVISLFEIQKKAAGGVAFPHMGNGAYFLLAAGIWIVPTIFMWSRANAMERFFSENPEAFLK